MRTVCTKAQQVPDSDMFYEGEKTDGRDEACFPNEVFPKLQTFVPQPAYFLAYLPSPCTLFNLILCFILLAFFLT